MSFEMGEAIRRCGLEKRGRRAVLDALACYTDSETGLARVSHVSLALYTGLSEKTVGRVLDALIEDAEMVGLVRLVRKAAGRGNPAVYRVDLGRLDPLASAIKVAGRRVFAGVGKRIADAGLVGAKATPDNIRQIFALLDDLLRSEEEFTTARTVLALRDEFESLMAERGEITVIGKPEASDEPVEDAEKGGHFVRVKKAEKGDTLSGKGDISTSAHNKDISPSGISSDAGDAGCGKIFAAAAVKGGNFLFDTEGLLAHATVNRSERRQLVADLQGRLARITPDDLLAIRARNAADAEALRARWLDGLLSWATDVGLAGVVIDGEFPPPAGQPQRGEG